MTRQKMSFLVPLKTFCFLGRIMTTVLLFFSSMKHRMTERNIESAKVNAAFTVATNRTKVLFSANAETPW